MHFNTGCGSIWKNYDFVDENVRGMVRERERERDQRRRQTDATPKSRSLRACVRVLLSERVCRLRRVVNGKRTPHAQPFL